MKRRKWQRIGVEGGFLHQIHPSKSFPMILILICTFLLLDMGTSSLLVQAISPSLISNNADPSRSSSSSSDSSINSTNPLVLVTSLNNNNSNNITTVSRTTLRRYNRRPALLRPSTTPPPPPFSSSINRRRRDPRPQQSQSSSPSQQSELWLYPPHNDPTRRPTDSSGLAYRSILPIRSNTGGSSSSGSTYRNPNLFSSSDGGNDYNYNYNYNDLDSSAASEGFSTGSSTTTTTGDLSLGKSAPPTDHPGSVSISTVEMSVGDRDGIMRQRERQRQSKHFRQRQGKVGQNQNNRNRGGVGGDQEASIIFPGSASRPHQITRGNKLLVPSSGVNVNTNSNNNKSVNLGIDEYNPPPLKSLDKAGIESLLKIVLERRKTAGGGGISIINNGKTNGGGYAGRIPTTTGKPGGVTTTATPLEIKGKPKCAVENSGYCEEIESYPKDFFNQVLKNSLTLSPQVFQEVFGDGIGKNIGIMDSDLTGRDGLPPLESQLCSSMEHTIYPKVAENKDGKFMYIVNHDEYIQGVRVEKCVREGSSCKFLEGLPGYESTCRQKYIYRKLLAFTRDGKATTDTFRLPACCVCHVRNLFVDDRINTGGSSSGGFFGGGGGGAPISSVSLPENLSSPTPESSQTFISHPKNAGQNDGLLNNNKSNGPQEDDDGVSDFVGFNKDADAKNSNSNSTLVEAITEMSPTDIPAEPELTMISSNDTNIPAIGHRMF